jgi:hypothetical protein
LWFGVKFKLPLGRVEMWDGCASLGTDDDDAVAVAAGDYSFAAFLFDPSILFAAFLVVVAVAGGCCWRRRKAGQFPVQ